MGLTPDTAAPARRLEALLAEPDTPATTGYGKDDRKPGILIRFRRHGDRRDGHPGNPIDARQRLTEEINPYSLDLETMIARSA
jgi:hypothetical protein